MPAADARHVMRQGRAIAALAATALRALGKRRRAGAAPPSLPGPELTARVPAPAPALVHDFVRDAGGDPDAYRATVPPHMFPQWSLALAARTLWTLPHPLLRMMNAGCRLEILAPLPASERFAVRARLAGIDDNGRRAVLHQRVITGTDAHAEALVADLYLVVPSAARSAGARAEAVSAAPRPRESALVPAAARELGRWTLGRHAGLTFAALTGDFNPVHWLRPYARAIGLPGTILHGFGTLARALEGLNRAQFGGAVDRLRVVDARFLRPLALPAHVGLYVDRARFFVGEAPGAPAYLAGSFEER